jgi:hypothetical protein
MLARLARALGGEVYAGGRRATVPAPGHTAADRSVSLRVVGDRLLVHSFGAADWREVLDDLRARGWIDGENRLLDGGAPVAAQPAPDPTGAERIAAAMRLWEEARPIRDRDPAARYARRRGVDLALDAAGALRSHALAPASVYRWRGPRRPALLAAVRDAGGALTAVEVTYLDAQGRRCALARPARKAVGVLPPGSAVRFTPAAAEMLVAEGIFTTLSAMRRFALPGWALLSTGNLRGWRAPEGVTRVLIAGDRGADGERSAFALRRALRSAGVAAEVALPPAGHGDWNDLDQEEAERKGRFGRPARRGGP